MKKLIIVFLLVSIFFGCTSAQHQQKLHSAKERGFTVRVNFQQKILDNKNGIIKIRQIDEQEFYQTFFNKVSKSIFIQKMGL